MIFFRRRSPLWLNLLEEPPEIRRIHAEMISFVTFAGT
jgi:hypothetical protein